MWRRSRSKASPAGLAFDLTGIRIGPLSTVLPAAVRSPQPEEIARRRLSRMLPVSYEMMMGCRSRSKASPAGLAFDLDRHPHRAVVNGGFPGCCLLCRRAISSA